MFFKGQGASKIPWGGTLGNLSFRDRAALMAAVLTASASITFSQMGFFAVHPGPGQSFYVVSLLALIAAAALVLGVPGGTLTGVACGLLLVLHATLQPLDVFETAVANPFAYCVLFGVMGLLLGVLFALALRNNPKGWRRLVYIALVCFGSSFIFTASFLALSFYQFVSVGAALHNSNPGMPMHEVSGYVIRRMGTLENLNYQVHANTLLMVVGCFLADFAARMFKFDRDARPLRVTFNMRLLITVFLCFMAVTATGFVVITEREKELSSRDMLEECTYLDEMRAEQEKRGLLYTQVTLNEAGDSEVLRENFRKYFSVESLLKGYEEELDGVVLIASGSTRKAVIVASDVSKVSVGSTLEDAFDRDTVDAIFESIKTNKVQGALYEDYAFDGETGFSPAELGYLVATCSTSSANSIVGDLTDQSAGYIYVIMRPASMVFSDRWEVVRWISQTAFVLMVAMYLLVSRLLDQVVIAPIKHMGEKLDAICEGKLDTLVDARGSSELVGLSAGINTTVDALKEWIAEAERRIDQELETARAIQRSALPSFFPPFPDISEFDLYASMEAAREVGGDFYDFFLVDEDTVAFLVADVSGKGIPASLFMMAAKAELDNYLSAGMDLVEAMGKTNARLCEGNEAEMFVTAWVATLDFMRGALTFVNAGHNHPLLRHDGRWTWVDQKGGLFMGSFASAKYRSSTIELAPGDELILYTDGVTEAFDVNGQQYGNDRLEAFLAAHAEMRPKELVEALKADVARWSEGEVQSDDITIFVLEYYGS